MIIRKFLGYLFTPIHYLAFGFFLCLFHPIQWLSLKVGGLEAHKKSVDLLNYFLVSTYYLVGCRVKFINNIHIPMNQPVIFIANHQSMYDIPPLIWFLRKYYAKFISKIELTRGIPSISFNLRHGGGANIDRKDSRQAVSEILKLGQRMQTNNWSAVIFPEGTRSRDGRIKPFATAGVAALLKKVPNALIVPVAIENSWKLVRFRFPLSFGERLVFQVLPPLDRNSKTVEELVSEAEQAIRRVMPEKA